MRDLVCRFGSDERGATSIEYGLIAGFIALAIINALAAINVELTSIFVDVIDGFKKRPAA